MPPRRALGRTQAARTPFAVLVIAMLVAGVVGLLMFNTNMQQASFKATALQERVNVLTAKEQSLNMELDAAARPPAAGRGRQGPRHGRARRSRRSSGSATAGCSAHPTPATIGRRGADQPAARAEARRRSSGRRSSIKVAGDDHRPARPALAIGTDTRGTSTTGRRAKAIGRRPRNRSAESGATH